MYDGLFQGGWGKRPRGAKEEAHDAELERRRAERKAHFQGVRAMSKAAHFQFSCLGFAQSTGGRAFEKFLFACPERGAGGDLLISRDPRLQR